MIRTIIAALLSLLSLLPALAASPVDTAARKAAGAPALKAVFTLNGAPGSLLMCGKMFAVDLPEMKIHFDGTTQWTHSVPDAEITIVTPTDAEIAFAVMNQNALSGREARAFQDAVCDEVIR